MSLAEGAWPQASESPAPTCLPWSPPPPPYTTGAEPAGRASSRAGVGTDGQREQLGAHIAGTAPLPGLRVPKQRAGAGLGQVSRPLRPQCPCGARASHHHALALLEHAGQSWGCPPGRAVLIGGPATSINLMALGRRCPSLRALS